MKVNLNKNKMTKTTTKSSKKVTVKKEVPWSRMSNKDKRVSIAKDVLKHIKAGSLIPTSGSYFSSMELYEEMNNIPSNKKIELQELLKGKTCEVCAKGALFISDIIRNDKFSVKKDTILNEGHMMCNRLEGIFDQGQLDLIECAFEGDVIWDATNILQQLDDDGWEENSSLAEEAIEFHDQYKGDDELVLTAIMNNIIENDGTFIP